MSAARTVAVLGAGAVGACAALALQRRGFAVTLIDSGEPGSGASYGNAGILSCSGVVPVATPTILKRVPKMLLDPLSPLAVRWSYLPKLAPWLWQFVRAGAPDRVEAIARALAPLSHACIGHWRDMLGTDVFRAQVREVGNLAVYKTDASFETAQWAWDLRRRNGVRCEHLQGDALRQQEPALSPDVKHGMFVPDGANVVDPQATVQAAAAQLRAAGGTVRLGKVERVERATDGRPALRVDGASESFDMLTIAAGAHSRRFVRDLGGDLPLDTERGYHAMLPTPAVAIRHAVSSGDHEFAITPMASGVRLAGTVELGGLDAAPNWERAKILMRLAPTLFPGLDTRDAKLWMGFRPSMPDSLPVIGWLPGSDRVLLAFGHGHLGLSFGAVTGAMIGAMAAGAPPPVDPSPYRAERFG